MHAEVWYRGPGERTTLQQKNLLEIKEEKIK